MSVVALFTWMATVLAGLVLLIIWIIEYDPAPAMIRRARSVNRSNIACRLALPQSLAAVPST